jgi:hypothetical protein
MNPSKLNLNYLRKTTAGKRWIKVYAPKEDQSLITKWLVVVGLVIISTFVAFLIGNQYYPEYTEPLLSFARNMKGEVGPEEKSHADENRTAEKIELAQQPLDNSPAKSDKARDDEKQRVNQKQAAEKPALAQQPLDNSPAKSDKARDDEKRRVNQKQAAEKPALAQQPLDNLPAKSDKARDDEKQRVNQKQAAEKPALVRQPLDNSPTKSDKAREKRESRLNSRPEPKATTNVPPYKHKKPAVTAPSAPPLSDGKKRPPESSVSPVPKPPRVSAPTRKADNGVVALLRQCETHLKANRLTTGKKGTAFECYHKVLAIDSDNAKAKAGLGKIEARYQYWAARALKRGKLASARRHIKRLRRVNPNSSALPKLQERLKTAEQRLARQRSETLSPPKPRTEKSQQQTPPKKPESRPAASPQERRTDKSQEPIPTESLPTASPPEWDTEQSAQQIPLKEPESPSATSPPEWDTEQSAQQIPLKEPESPSAASPPEWDTEKSQRQSPRRTTSEPPEQQRIITPQPPQSRPPLPAQCSDILFQESLGIRPLTPEQKEFKRESCN